MSFNIRFASPTDGDNRWELRRSSVADMVRKFDGDFVGLQEVLPEQLAFLKQSLPSYGCISRSRDADPTRGEAGPIFYHDDRWSLDTLQHGTFWLSPTPTIAGSTGWWSGLPRIVTWARFVDKKTGCGVYVYNTHFSHFSLWARLRSGMLLARRIAQRAHPEPVIVTGDFNGGETSLAIEYLKGRLPGNPVRLIDTFRAVHPLEWFAGTYHAFRGVRIGPKIDYIFTLPGADVRRADIVRDRPTPRYPSDHFPVIADLLVPSCAP